MATKAKAKPKAKVFAGLEAPRALCPFSGEPLQFVRLSNGDWQVRGNGWVSTRLFPFKSQAEYFFSHELGVPPAFPNPLEVGDERKPPDPAQAEVEASLRAADKFGERAAEILTK